MSSRFSSHSLTFAWRLRALGVLSSQLRLSGSVVPRSGPSLSFGDAWGPARQSEPEPCNSNARQSWPTSPFPSHPRLGTSSIPASGLGVGMRRSSVFSLRLSTCIWSCGLREFEIAWRNPPLVPFPSGKYPHGSGGGAQNLVAGDLRQSVYPGLWFSLFGKSKVMACLKIRDPEKDSKSCEPSEPLCKREGRILIGSPQEDLD